MPSLPLNVRLCQFGSFSPSPLKDKAGDRFSSAGTEFLRAERFRQTVDLRRIPDSDYRERLEAFRHVVNLPHLFRIESGHLMDNQAECGGLRQNVSHRQSDVVSSMSIRFAGAFKVQFGD